MNQQDKLQILRHGVGGVFVRRATRGRLFVLAHHYAKKGTTTLRLPSGTCQPHESVFATLRREMLEEVAAQPDDFEFRLVFPKPVYFKLDHDDSTGKVTFLKVFFALEITRGIYRNSELVDDAGTPDEELLGPLYWWDIGDLLSLLTLRVHQLAVAATLLLLAQSHGVIHRRYKQTLSHWTRHTYKLQMENPAVTEYVTRAF